MTRWPLASVSLCQDCNCVVNSLTVCECGSKALLGLDGVLNRPPTWNGKLPRKNPCDDCIEVGGHFYCDMNCGPAVNP